MVNNWNGIGADVGADGDTDFTKAGVLSGMLARQPATGSCLVYVADRRFCLLHCRNKLLQPVVQDLCRRTTRVANTQQQSNVPFEALALKSM